MLEHVRNWFPWHERARRKAEFVKKLQNPGHGQPKIRFKDINSIPIGTIIMINAKEGNTITIVRFNQTSWMIYGTSIHPSTKTNIEVEDMLTEMRAQAGKDDETIIYDAAECLNIDYKAHPTNMNFSKIKWTEIGNDEDN